VDERVHVVGDWGPGRAVLMQTCRTAIRAAADILGIGRGDEVLVPAYNCGSEVDPLIRAGARPVMYRVSRGGEIDLGDVAVRVTRASRAVYVTHFFGFPQPMEGVKRLCREKGLALIEDCALALWSRRGDGVAVGAEGDVSVFSFPKTLPVPDGGALVVNNPDLPLPSCRRAAPVRPVLRRLMSLAKGRVCAGPGRARAAGAVRRAVRRARRTQEVAAVRPDMPRSYYFDERLADRRISRVSAWMLRRVDRNEVVRSRREKYEFLLAACASMSGVRPMYGELPAGVCPLAFPVLVEDRDGVCSALNRRGVPAIPWWAGYHRDLAWDGYPDACYLKDHVVAVPIGRWIGAKHLEEAVRTLRAAGGGAA
jgi:perosamine synthetase